MSKLLGSKIKVKPAAKELGFVLYEGNSVLDGKPIAAIATLSSSNVKTGNMVQVWIIRTDINPVEASKLGEDVSICGNCIHRHYNKGACYVNIGQAPNAVYKSYIAGKYPKFDYQLHSGHINHRKIRFGSYGDPGAVPFEVLEKFSKLSLGHTAYTHQINHRNFDMRFLELCMVSADSPKPAKKFQSLGAKTFRVAMEGDSLDNDEIECKSDSDNIQCIDCGLCDGKSKNIAIAVHGSRSKNFKTNLIAVGA